MAEWRTLKTEDFALWGDIFIYSVNRLIAWLVFCIQNQLNSSSERFQRKLIYIWQFNVRAVSPSWKVDVTERIEEKQVSLPYKHITKIFFEGHLDVEFTDQKIYQVVPIVSTIIQGTTVHRKTFLYLIIIIIIDTSFVQLWFRERVLT